MKHSTSCTEPELHRCCFFFDFFILNCVNRGQWWLCASLRLRCSAWEVTWKIKSSSVALLGYKKEKRKKNTSYICQSSLWNTLRTNKACAVGRKNMEACSEGSLKLSRGYSCELLQKYPMDSLQGSWRYCEKTYIIWTHGNFIFADSTAN